MSDYQSSNHDSDLELEDEDEDDDYSPSPIESSESGEDDGGDADRQAHLRACEENAHKLSHLITCPQVEFDAHTSRNSTWFEVLTVPKPDIHKDVVTKISTLRKLFQDHPFLVDSGSSFARSLGMLGKVQCSVCRHYNKKHGIMSAKRGVVSKHPKDGAHLAHLTTHNAAQLRVDEMPGFVEGVGGENAIRKRFMALAVGKFVGGGDGCAGIPPSS